MGVARERWINRQATDIGSLTGAEDQIITYEQCMDNIYTLINQVYLANQESVAELSTEQLHDYNGSIISNYVSDKKPLVAGYVNNGHAEFGRLIVALIDDITNMGPLTEALEDESITELQINDYKTIYAEQSGETRLLLDKITGKPVQFKSATDALKICNKLLKLSDVTLSRVGAIQGGMTREGFRVAAVHSSVSSPEKGDNRLRERSPTAVIRKFSKNPYNLYDLVNFHSMTMQIAEYIKRIPKASLATIVSGATGSGKTVLLQAFVDERPMEKRTFIIEDQSELNARHRNADGVDESNTVQFEARPVPAGGSVSQSFPTYENLIMQGMRMSPRLFILGEMRTNEVINQAVVAANTGHPFYTTIHAEDVEDTLSRIAQAVAAATPSIPYNVILDTVCKNITFIISQQKLDDGTRKLLQLAEICGTRVVDGIVRPDINMLFEFIGDGQGIHEDQKLHGDYYQVGCISANLKKRLALKKLTKQDLDILCGGPHPGEAPIKGDFNIPDKFLRVPAMNPVAPVIVDITQEEEPVLVADVRAEKDIPAYGFPTVLPDQSI